LSANKVFLIKKTNLAPMKLKCFSYLLFFLFLLGIVAFYLWSKLLGVSIILLITSDSITLRYLSKKLKTHLSTFLYTGIKWGYFIFIPVLFAIFIRTFFFDIYFVPSSSMERTLFPNDYVVINKITYGTKIPKRIQDIPVIGGLFKVNNSIHEYNLYTPLKGYKNFKREDIVVFKSVEENDSFLIKRIIGMPSDTLHIKDSHVYINSLLLKDNKLYCYNYNDSSTKGIELVRTYSNEEYSSLDIEQKKYLKTGLKIKPRKMSFLFPYTKRNQWTRDNYGKIIIPKKGMKMVLDQSNLDIYKYIIKNYEKKTLKLSGNEFITYTFKNNYYFMMGDNRHNSSDSRSYGFVPESYIQGKMVYVFSKERLLN